MNNPYLTLQQRRDIARAKTLHRLGIPDARLKSGKVFNMKWLSETLDDVIEELSEYSKREPELKAAVSAVVAAKELISAYSQRTLDTPFKNATDDKE